MLRCALCIAFFLSTLLLTCAFSQQESLIITSYYPSPFGSYRELTAHRMKIGTNYSGSGTTVADNTLIVEGFVGIGLTDPGGYRLRVRGDVGLDTDPGVGGALRFIENGTQRQMIAYDPPGGYLYGYNWALTRDFMRSYNTGNVVLQPSGGNVGIGAAAPGQRLTIGSGNIILPNANGGTDGNLYFGGLTDSGQNGLRLFGGLVNGVIPAGFIDVKTTDPTDGLRFRVDTANGGTERMRIRADGAIVTYSTLSFKNKPTTTDCWIVDNGGGAGGEGLYLNSDQNSATVMRWGVSDWKIYFKSTGPGGGGYIWAPGGQTVFLNVPADISELYAFLPPRKPQAGEILIATELNHTRYVMSSQKPYQQSLVGVVSTKPAITIGNTTHSDEELKYKVPVALAGRLPVRVIVRGENDSIQVGDYITSSSIPGFGMKATHAGPTVGKALESFVPDDSRCQPVNSIEDIPWPDDDGENPARPCFKLPDGSYMSKVMSLVSVSYAQPNETLASNLSDSAGSGQIKSEETKAIVLTNQVSLASRIFITPRSSTNGQSLFVDSVEPGRSFTVNLDHPVKHVINFDWQVTEGSGK